MFPLRSVINNRNITFRSVYVGGLRCTHADRYSPRTTRIVEVLGADIGRVFGVGACVPSCGSGALVYLHLVGRGWFAMILDWRLGLPKP